MKSYQLKNRIDLDYAINKLIGTVVNYNGKAIRVEDITNSGKVIFTYLRDGRMGDDHIDFVDITPVQLGYVNYNRNATYITRLPMRRDWRQGLRNANISTSNGRMQQDIPFSQIASTIEGDFPKLLDVLVHISKGNINSMAFSRNFSVLYDHSLQFKGRFNIGKIDDENGKFFLHPNMEWSREMLEKEMAA